MTKFQKFPGTTNGECVINSLQMGICVTQWRAIIGLFHCNSLPLIFHKHVRWSFLYILLFLLPMIELIVVFLRQARNIFLLNTNHKFQTTSNWMYNRHGTYDSCILYVIYAYITLLCLLQRGNVELHPGPLGLPSITFLYGTQNVRNMCCHISMCQTLRVLLLNNPLNPNNSDDEVNWITHIISHTDDRSFSNAVNCLYAHWSTLSEQFILGTQFDFHEYFMYVFQRLSSLFLNFHSLYFYQQLSQSQCLCCGNTINASTNVNHIVVEPDINMSQSLQQYYMGHYKAIPDYNCEVCGSHNAQQTVRITSYPEVFICVVNRFSTTGKVTTLLDVPTCFDIGNVDHHEHYVTSCIILHHGDILDQGHYSVLANCVEGWLHMDDNNLTLHDAFPHHLAGCVYMSFSVKTTECQHASHNGNNSCYSAIQLPVQQPSSSPAKSVYLSNEMKTSLREYLHTHPNGTFKSLPAVFNISRHQFDYYKKQVCHSRTRSNTIAKQACHAQVMSLLRQNKNLSFKDVHTNFPSITKISFSKLKKKLHSNTAIVKRKKCTQARCNNNMEFHQSDSPAGDSGSRHTATDVLSNCAVNQNCSNNQEQLTILNENDGTDAIKSFDVTSAVDNYSNVSKLNADSKAYLSKLLDYRRFACVVCQMLCKSANISTASDLQTAFLRQLQVTPPNSMICHKCAKFLDCHKTLPKNADYYLKTGSIPQQLQNLNIIEKRIISIVQPFITIMVLPLGQRALKGQVIHFPSAKLQIANAISASLPDIVIVEQEQNKQLPAYHFASKSKVSRALTFLQQSNPLYSVDNICIENLEILSDCLSTNSLPPADAYSTMPIDYTNTVSVPNFLGTCPQVTLPRSSESPINMFECKDLEEKCFPWLFPYSIGTFTKQENLQLKHYCSTRIFHKSLSFAKDTAYVFWLFNNFQLQRLKNAISIALKKKNISGSYSSKLTLNNLRNDPNITQHAWTMLKPLRGSDGYWQSTRSDLISTFSTIGAPTFFVTFSANDLHWPELYKEIIDLNKLTVTVNELSKQDRIKLLTENAIIALEHFMTRWQAFFTHIILGPSKILGQIEDYFWRIEMQNRGSPHVHLLLWIANAPNLDDPAQAVHVPSFIDKYISVDIPDSTRYPVLHKKVTTFQTHTHSFTCQSRKSKNKSHCRFNFPQPPQSTTCLRFLDGISAKSHFYLLKRHENASYINAYNPVLLDLWNANMDIQMVGSTLGMAYYLTSYLCKPEPGGSLKDTLHSAMSTLPANSTLKKALFKLGGATFSQRKVSIQEALLLMTDHLLKKSSRIVIYIDCKMPEERVYIGHKFSDTPNGCDDADNDTEISQPAVFTHYSNRPLSLDNASLFKFANSYTYSSNKASGNSLALLNNDGFVTPRVKQACLKWVKGSLTTDRDLYFYKLLLLHFPHRNELELIIPFKSYYESFCAKQSFLEMPSANHDQYRHLMDILQMSNTLSNDEYDDIAAHLAPASHDFSLSLTNIEDDSSLHLPDIDDTGDDMTSSPSFQVMSDNVFATFISSLNKKQKEIYDVVAEHIRQTIAFLIGQISTPPTPIYMFITGSAGSGKSRVLTAIRQLMKRSFPTDICVVSAPTGVAAFGINGCTIHRTYQLPIQRQSKGLYGQYTRLQDDKLQEMRKKFHDVHYNIIEEISMVSYDNFINIHRRLNEIKTPNSTNLFGKTSVICFGDLMQLRPVKAKFIFEQTADQDSSFHLWKDNMIMYELTENMRQQNDKQFGLLCDRFRFGIQSPNDIEMLRKRQLPSEQLACPPFKNALRIFPTNAKCDDYNNEKLALLPNTVSLHATDIVISSNYHSHGSTAPPNLIPSKDQDCAGLPKLLKIAVGAEVMLRRNLDTTAGLVNGARGKVLNIQYDQRSGKALTISVKFYNISNNCQQMDVLTGGVDITPVSAEYYGLNKTLLSRTQFPLVLSYAVTVHRCQGLTLDAAVIDLSKDLFQSAMAYVALSRVRSLDKVAIIELDTSSIGFKASSKAIDEMHRLQNL